MCKVLVVENSPAILKLICYHLETMDCSVTTASNGLEALVKIDKDIPDIIFTDIIMPKISGDQLCTIIRKDRKLKEIFIAVHSSTSLEDNRQILELDADVYIAKGPEANLKDHIFHVIDQYRKGIRRSQTTIGGDSLYPREITKELLLARKHYHAIFNSVAEAVVEMDCNGMIVQANTATQKLLRRGLLRILSTKFTDHIEGPEKQKVIDWIAQVKNADFKKNEIFSSSYETPMTVCKRRVLLNLVAIEGAEGLFIIGILQDITEQKATEETLAKTLNEFNAVINTIDYGILLLDADLRIRIVNQAYRELWGMPKEFTDRRPTFRELMEYNNLSGIYDIPPENADEYIHKRIKAIRRGNIAPIELKLRNGKVLQYQCAVLPDNGRLLTFYDITSLKNTGRQLEEALEKVSNLANHDPLTGLPNLRLARERLHSAVTLSRRKGWMTAVMFIDLDGFKEVNDSHGHDIGDQVLQEVAGRLEESLRQADTVARIGGDEFLVIQTEVPHRLAAAKVAGKIVQKVSEPMIIGGNEITIGASIGIAVYPQDGEESRVLMKKADDAMYYTKRIGKNNYTFTPS